MDIEAYSQDIYLMHIKHINLHIFIYLFSLYRIDMLTLSYIFDKMGNGYILYMLKYPYKPVGSIILWGVLY